MSFLAELKRRKVFQAAGVYAIVAWLIIQVADVLLPTYGAPGWVMPVFTSAVILGFPLAVTLAWFFDLTSSGPVRTPDARKSMLGTAGTSAQKGVQLNKSVVVIPFRNMSSDPENEYFVDGLTEEIIADLSKISGLRVISRNSAMRLKATDRDLQSIAEELSVKYALDGSVRKESNAIRVTAQLVDIDTDRQLWGDKFTGELSDVFGIQEQISFAIADALKIQLSDDDAASLEQHDIVDLRAYDCYMKARYEYGKFSAEGGERSIRYLKQALELDTDNLVLHVAIGWAYLNYASAAIGAEVHEEFLGKAEHHARIVLENAPDSADGNGLLGMILYDRFDTLEGLRLLRKGANTAGRGLDTLIWAAFCYSMCGQAETARPWVEELASIDPLHGFSQWAVGWCYLMQGDFQAAETYIRHSLEVEPKAPNVRTGLAILLVFSDRRQEAIDILAAGQPDASQQDVWSIVGNVFYEMLSENPDAALRLISDELKRDAKTDMFYSWLLADCYAMLGQKEEAIDWLENAVRGGFWNYQFFRHIDPMLSNLRDLDSFDKLMSETREKWRSIKT